MVNPGAFQGLRKQFLMNEKAAYKAGVIGGYAADALANIQRRYFRRFPIDLPHDQEPDGHFLAAVNDNAPEEELQIPEMENLSQEEYNKAIEVLKERRKMIEFRKAQIKRWLAYQYMKDTDMDARESGKENPYHWMLVKLSGMEAATKPRLRTAVNTWRKSQAKEINAESKRLCGSLPKNQQAAARDKTAKKMFEKLSEEEKAQWSEQAKEDYEERISSWKARMAGQASTNNADRQRAIQGLTRCMKPLLDMVCEATGWKCSLIAGGPEPAHGGRLNIISVHSGETSGELKVNFGRAERARYHQHFVPTYGDFLKSCYTPEECRSRALPDDEGFENLETLGLDADGINFDSLGLPEDAPASTTARAPSAASGSPSQQRSVPVNSSSASSQVPVRVQAAETDTRIRSVSPPLPASRAAAEPLRATSLPPINPPAPTPPGSPSQGISPAPSPAPTPPGSPARGLSPQFPSALSPTTIPPTGSVAAKNMTEPSETSDGPPSNPSLPGGEREEARLNERSPVLPLIPSKRVADTSAEDDELAPSSKRTRAVARKESTPASKTPSTRATKSVRTQKSTPSTKARGRAAATSSTEATSSSTSNTVSTSPVLKIPQWFSSAEGMLKSKVIDARFTTLVQTWAAFEAKENYKEVAVLESKGRPSEIGAWIGRARRPTWAPKNVDVETFETAFKTWWYKLQPAWRRDKDEVCWGSIAGDLSALRRPGLNGLLSVVAALFFWGINAKKASNGWDEYIICVNDVQAVLSALVCPPVST